MWKFTIYISKNSQYYFVLTAGNGEPILSGETYTTMQACKDGIASVKVNSQIDEQYKRYKSKDDQRYFVLEAKNGEPLWRSEMYTTQEARDNGILSVKQNAPTATVV